jgi:hypothetical protein
VKFLGAQGFRESGYRRGHWGTSILRRTERVLDTQ